MKINTTLRKVSFCLAVIPLVLLGLYVAYLYTLETIPKIDETQVQQIEIQFSEGSDVVIRKYTDKETISRFVKAFNQAHYYTNDVGTTHPVSVSVLLRNGDVIGVWGGSQGFQTIVNGNDQYNIQGWALEYLLRQFKNNLKTKKVVDI